MNDMHNIKTNPLWHKITNKATATTYVLEAVMMMIIAIEKEKISPQHIKLPNIPAR